MRRRVGTLELPGGAASWSCTKAVGVDGEMCKHVIAITLAATGVDGVASELVDTDPGDGLPGSRRPRSVFPCAGRCRRNLDLDKATVAVVASASELANGTRILGDPKSYAGRRTVSIPGAIIPALADHLEQFAEPGPDGVVFVGPKGGPLRRGNFNTSWHALARGAQLEGLRFHDYADIRVMPMCSRCSCSVGVSVVERSA